MQVALILFGTNNLKVYTEEEIVILYNQWRDYWLEEDVKSFENEIEEIKGFPEWLETMGNKWLQERRTESEVWWKSLAARDKVSLLKELNQRGGLLRANLTIVHNIYNRVNNL